MYTTVHDLMRDKRNIASLCVLCCFMVLALGSLDTDQDTSNVKDQTPVYTLSADELYTQYSDNEVAADSKYKGRIVVVSGVVQSIGKDIMDDAYVVIGGEGFLDGVQCMFTVSENAAVGRLSKGRSVRIKGEVRGGGIGNVLMTKCSLQW